MKEETGRGHDPSGSSGGGSDGRARGAQEQKIRRKRVGRNGGQRPVGGDGAPRSKTGGASDYPRHPVQKALRIPRAILEQNAGKPCTDRDAARFSGMGYHGPFAVELSSAIKYGFLSRPKPGTVELTDLAKKS